MEGHVTGMVPDNGCGVRGGVVHEHFAGIHGFLGGGVLFSTDLIDGGEHCRVDSSGVVEQRPDTGLNVPNVGFIQFGSLVDWCQLELLAVGRLGPLMWGELWSGWNFVLQAFECRGNVAWHRDVDKVFGVIPFDGEAAIVFAVPIDGDFVVCSEGLEKVIGIGGRK